MKCRSVSLTKGEKIFAEPRRELICWERVYAAQRKYQSKNTIFYLSLNKIICHEEPMLGKCSTGKLKFRLFDGCLLMVLKRNWCSVFIFLLESKLLEFNLNLIFRKNNEYEAQMLGACSNGNFKYRLF